jgi:hypothetical protein
MCVLGARLARLFCTYYKKDFYWKLTDEDTCDMQLSSKHQYYHQVQGALHIMGAEVSDFLSGFQKTVNSLE